MKNCVFIFCVLLKTVSSSFCYWNSGCPYKYFSDKTPYNNVRGDIRDSIVKLKGCEPISIWALLSSGKSIPDNIDRSLNESLTIRDNAIFSYKQGKSSICAQDIENLESWSADKNIFSSSNALTDEGSQELIGIANRLQKAFPNLLQNLRGNFNIASASSRVTEESAKNFVKGFPNEHLNIEKANDNIAAPHKTCKKYQNNLQNPNTYTEINKYKKTGEYLATKDRIQRRLGIDFKLSDDNVKSLYDLCRFNWSGINNQFSPWCALFTTEDLRVLEYIGDLEHYYKYGYGNDINKLLGRRPMADLLKTFQEVRDGKGKTLVAYFTDTATLNMVATALNLFKDEYALSAKRDPKRKWRNTKLSVFSANLLAVLNRHGTLKTRQVQAGCYDSIVIQKTTKRSRHNTQQCLIRSGNSEWDYHHIMKPHLKVRCGQEGDTDFNVVFYWNEEPLLPICERGFCSWDEFNNKLLPFVNATFEICNK